MITEEKETGYVYWWDMWCYNLDASANHYLLPLTSSPPGITQCKRLPRGRARESIVWIGLPYHLPIELSKVLVLDVGISGDRDGDCENHSIIT